MRQYYRDEELERNLSWHRVLQGYVALMRDLHRDKELEDLSERIARLENTLKERGLM